MVRNLFLALLLLNLAFFGWAQWVDHPRDVMAATKSVATVPSLELATLPPATQSASAQPPAASAPSLTHCRSIGPFSDAVSASAAIDSLRSRGLQPRPRSVDTTVPDGYWVYVEDLKDAAARRKVITTLNAAGMRDAAVMPDETERVSVGVFSDQRHAVHRAEQVQELGFKPVLSVHQRTVATPWIDVDLKASDADPSFGKPGASDSPRVIDCPVKASSG